MLYIKNIGISTSTIINIENFADILIEEDIYSIGKNSKDREAEKNVLEEAQATNLPVILLEKTKDSGKSVNCFTNVLKKIKQECVILCVQDGADGGKDAAAIVVTPFEPKTALAVITNISMKGNGKKARLEKLYKSQGPVLDALAVLECCIAKNYGFDFTQDWSGEIFLDRNYIKDVPLICKLSDAIIEVKQAKGKEEFQKKKSKFILPLYFATAEQLLYKFDKLRSQMFDIGIEELSKEYMLLFMNVSNKEKVVVFLVSSIKELEDEILLFLKEKNNWFAKGYSWNSKRGSCYTTMPLGKNAKICYINPPGGMFSKVQFYRLYRAIPQLKSMISQNRITEESKSELISRYYFEIIAIFFTVKILKIVGVEQNAIIGGSLGELSIPLIMDVAKANGQLLKTQDCSLDIMYKVIHLLEDVIASQPELSKKYFGIQIDNMEKWYLICDYQLIKKELKKLPENSPLFATIIGSPKDVIICGTHEMCVDLISKVHCYASQFKDPIYAHTPVLEPLYKEIQERMRKTGVCLMEGLPFDIYRTFKQEKMGTKVEEFADNYADCLIKQVDMPGIFYKAYEDDCRIFIDLGSSLFCSRWAKETLKDKKDAFVFSLYDKNIPVEGILSMMTMFLANKININDKLFLKWYLGDETIEKEEVDCQVEAVKNDWKKDFMERLIFDQMKRNHVLFQQYFHNQKKMLGQITSVDKRNFIDKKKECLYNYEQILEMTDGSMAKVLGEDYKEVDQYDIRARMPLPPYLFVSRITKINAKYGEFKAGSSIEAEYDVPYHSIMQVNRKTVSSVVFSEAAHIGIFLAGYMGIDAFSSGRARFRITDVTTKYVSEKWPNVGDTIQMEFLIDKLIRNGDITLLICSYKVYLENELIIDAKEIGGFFTKQALNSGAGIKKNVTEISDKESYIKNNIYKPVTKKRIFSDIELHDFLCGDYQKCLKSNIVNSDTPYQVCEEAMFIDEITDMSETGGKYGLGYIIAKKEIDRTYWPFKSHFKNDPVLPGTIMLEGISQALTFFQTCMGIYNTEKPFVTKLNTGHEIQTKFRGEVKCASHTLIYRVDPKKVKRAEGGLLFMADGEVYCDGVQVIEQKNASILIAETS